MLNKSAVVIESCGALVSGTIFCLGLLVSQNRTIYSRVMRTKHFFEVQSLSSRAGAPKIYTVALMFI